MRPTSPPTKRSGPPPRPGPSALVSQLASATEEYLARWGARDVALTEDLMAAAFELAEAVVACELRTRPDRALQVAKAVLADLPAGPVVVRVHPDDEAFMREATGSGRHRRGR